jgi:adenosylhomocysteine nucleosidase
MDTSPLGDPKGLISGINKIYFEADARAMQTVIDAAESLGLNVHSGTIASGDKFVATSEEKHRIAEEFDASVCEMEGAAIAHTAFVNGTPFCVIRAISDSADEGSSMDYMEFLPIAAKNSSDITEEFCKRF